MSGAHHARSVARPVAGIATDPMRILLIRVKINRPFGIGIGRALLIPEGGRVDPVARRILYLVVDMVGALFAIAFLRHADVAHCSDQLTRQHRVPNRDMWGIGVEDFVQEAVRIPDGYSAKIAVAGVLYHTVYWRAQRRMTSIQ